MCQLSFEFQKKFQNYFVIKFYELVRLANCVLEHISLCKSIRNAILRLSPSFPSTFPPLSLLLQFRLYVFHVPFYLLTGLCHNNIKYHSFYNT